MPYKVFLVEDEIVTREGIRDNVDWKAAGFEFCGEASDGETALVQLRTIKPDILFTDIKMPFMDGLQLGKIVREQMPWMKIIILSGHDEFEYAQEAINIGVTEYLLKPITVKDMHKVLRKLAAQLDQEKKEQETLSRLQEQLEANNVILKEKLLLEVVTGTVNSAEAINKGQALGLDLIAKCYLIVILGIKIGEHPESVDYEKHQKIQNMISGVVGNNPDVFLLKKGWNELVLLIKGNIPTYVEEECNLILDSIKKAADKAGFQLVIGIGTQKSRIADIYESLIEAYGIIQNAISKDRISGSQIVEKTELLKVNKSAVETFLKCGDKNDFVEFYTSYFQPLSETALGSFLIKNYLFMDVALAAINLINEMGGNIDSVIPEIKSIEFILANIKTTDQLKEEIHKLLVNAMNFRDGQTSSQHKKFIQQAKDYIDQHYMESGLSLYEVASQVNLSPSHFSLVFSQETCQTFKEYLTATRIIKAKELLRTSTLSSNDISYQVGFNDPHYFSYVFKKNTGMSPTEFRSKILG